jgi:Tol biopolymer transport system component
MRRKSTSDGFGAKTVLKNVNSSADDFDPWLSSDGLMLLFHSNRAGTDDLFWSARPTLADDFGTVAAFTSLNTADYAEAAPTLTRDKHQIYFASTRSGDEEIYEAVASE